MRRYQARLCALRTLGFPVALFLLINHPVPAAVTSDWITDSGGDFSNLANWDNGVPGSADTAVFRRGNKTYTVQITGSKTTNEFHIGTDNVTLQPATMSASFTALSGQSGQDSGLVIGEFDGDTAVLNSSLPSLRFTYAELGASPNSSGTLNLLAGTIFNSSINVGKVGTGTVNISHGAIANAVAANVGDKSGGTGTISITGPGTSWIGNIILTHGSVKIVGGGRFSGTFAMATSAFSPSTTVLVDGPGSTLTTMGKLNISSEIGLSQMTITNGGVVQSGLGGIADSGGASNGVTTVDGIGSAWMIQGDLNVGRFGTGNLTIVNGGVVKDVNGSIGSATQGIGSVTVDGPGSTWASSGALYVGPRTGPPSSFSGRGELDIIRGGTVTTAAGGIIDVTSSAHLDGAGSQWSVGGNLNVNGALSIANGAHVSSANATLDSTLGPAQITISGPGAKLMAQGDMIINSGSLSVSDGGELATGGTFTNYSAVQGNGTITGNVTNYGVLAPVGSPGRLTIAGNLAQGLFDYGTVQIEIGGTQAGVNYDQLVVTGRASLGGTLEVLLTGGFTPALGDAFGIINAANFDSSFSHFLLPKLANGLLWNTSQLSTTGVISVFSGLLGDFNQDGRVNAGDIPVMLAALADLNAYETAHSIGTAICWRSATLTTPAPSRLPTCRACSIS